MLLVKSALVEECQVGTDAGRCTLTVRSDTTRVLETCRERTEVQYVLSTYTEEVRPQCTTALLMLIRR
eukprot:SAG11_NODE_11005_length_790_cov_1.004342_1_plen_68_part_00